MPGITNTVEPLIQVERKAVRNLIVISVVFLLLAVLLFAGAVGQAIQTESAYLDVAEKAVGAMTTLTGLFPLASCKQHWLRLEMLKALRSYPGIIDDAKLSEYMGAIVKTNLGV